MAASTVPLFTFDHAAVIHHADGTKSLRWNLAKGCTDASSKRVFSLQPNGAIEDRPDTAIDIWEKGVIEDRELVFRTEKAIAVFAWKV